MARVSKDAAPATAALLVVPPSVPPGVPEASDTEIVEVADVRVLNASRSCTWTIGRMAAPAAVSVGGWAKKSLVGAAAVIVKLLLVAPARPDALAVSVYPAAALVSARELNDAGPAGGASLVAAPSASPV